MRQLIIFDDRIKIATITPIGNGSILIFARTSREWIEMKRLSGYADPKDKDYLEKIASKAHEFDYNTELSDKHSSNIWYWFCL